MDVVTGNRTHDNRGDDAESVQQTILKNYYYYYHLMKNLFFIELFYIERTREIELW